MNCRCAVACECMSSRSPPFPLDQGTEQKVVGGGTFISRWATHSHRCSTQAQWPRMNASPR